METGVHELTPGYALDALDPEERRAYEAHLSSCERCQNDLASFWETTEALAVAASGPVPSPELRDRILAVARAERPVVVPLESRRPRAVPVLAAAAAMAALVAVAVGFWASRISDDLDEARLALEHERMAAAVLADPASRTVALQAGEGRLVVDPDGRAVLVLDGLDAAPSEKAYEAWIVESGTPRPAGLFPGHDGLDVVGLDGTVGKGDVVAVTIEKKSGVKKPSTKPIVASQPV
jgi:anti-sigma factor RsiW